jgi:RND family efflux transporter MFP subunit
MTNQRLRQRKGPRLFKSLSSIYNLESFVLTLSLLMAVLFLWSCSGSKPPEAPLVPVIVQPVGSYSGTTTARYSASIVPYAQVNLAFKVGGYIEEILLTKGPDGQLREVQEGEFVRKGTVLARIREDDYKAALNQAQGAAAQAQAANVKANQDYQRAASLYSSQSMTKSDYDGAVANLNTTKGQVEQTNGALESAQISMGDTELRAPIDGVILQRSIEIGSFAGPGTLGYVLADIRTVKAVFGVPDFVVSRAKLGMPIHINTDSIPGFDVKGEVTAISAAADQSSRLFNVEVTIPNPGYKLKAGMIATVDLKQGDVEQVPTSALIVVPLSAVVRAKDNPNGYSVFVVQQESGKQIAHSRVVKVGDVYGNRIAVEGVKIGETVIVNGATLVIDGQEVRITQ